MTTSKNPKKEDKDKTVQKPVNEPGNVPVEKTELELKLEELQSEKAELEARLTALQVENAELTDGLKRLAAEFDNFRKRTIREKDDIYKNATATLVEAFLPVLDGMELAYESVAKNADKAALQKGIELVYRQFMEVLDKLDIEEIECLGESFDPNLHNAVMHVTDEGRGDNEVIDVLKKGYIFKDKVIRHSMVKVAN
ncbi:MAG: nucleotide exchange factor GrpE [Clostridia bacterium]|nr:nucleotide exchange factor GrpE [Clostridia bacterium]